MVVLEELTGKVRHVVAKIPSNLLSFLAPVHPIFVVQTITFKANGQWLEEEE